MGKRNLTLNEIIVELQKMAEKHGEKEVLSFGGASGIVRGMNSPHTVSLIDKSEVGMGDSYYFKSKAE